MNETTGGAEVLVLSARPLAPQEVLSTVDVVSEQGHLGGPGGALPVREGRITVGMPTVYQQAEDPGLLNPAGDRFYAVELRFTLTPLEERRYERVRFGLRITTPRVTAMELLPSRITSKEEVNQTFELGTSFALQKVVDVNAKAGFTRAVKFENLRPVITSYRNDGSTFYWVLEGSDGQPVASGDRNVLAVLKAPREVGEIQAMVDWDVRLTRSKFGVWKEVEVTAESTPLPVVLR